MKQLVAWALLGCGCAGMSDYKRCRIAASFESNPIAQAVAMGNCEQVANRELVAAVHRERMQANAEEQQRELERQQLESQRAAAADQQRTRANPKAPDIGATTAESKQLCERQGGYHAQTEFEGGLKLTCTIGGSPAYLAVVDDEMVSMRKVFIEGGDAVAIRERLEEKLGAADDIQIVKGFRAWTWRRDGSVVVISSYNDGATVLTGIEPDSNGAE